MDSVNYEQRWLTWFRRKFKAQNDILGFYCKECSVWLWLLKLQLSITEKPKHFPRTDFKS